MVPRRLTHGWLSNYCIGLAGYWTNGDIEGPIATDNFFLLVPVVSGYVIGPHLFGRVHFCEVADSWLNDPLSRYQEGQFVKCKVLEASTEVPSFKRVEMIDELHPNMEVHGYIKNVSPKGCFVMLSRKLDARILISNLSDGVLSVELSSKRIDLTLKENAVSQLPKPDTCSFSSLHVGDIISGYVRRVETYGWFCAIFLRLSDDDIDHIEIIYRAGERVLAKILKIDLRKSSALLLE
ncbi:hypothetical protein HPP92_015877 [Vanilla planifolia]|uniref:S1 motif domain-containing protein n=1 Tax=Vanilla planifolia TaxID=51239 RepID=A0A835QIP1_VANPL|nr:hypothetical protein HPP92_015877 [Vanilla planifolia]